jgi:hypothetical protein
MMINPIVALPKWTEEQDNLLGALTVLSQIQPYQRIKIIDSKIYSIAIDTSIFQGLRRYCTGEKYIDTLIFVNEIMAKCLTFSTNIRLSSEKIDNDTLTKHQAMKKLYFQILSNVQSLFQTEIDEKEKGYNQFLLYSINVLFHAHKSTIEQISKELNMEDHIIDIRGNGAIQNQ